MIVKNFNIAPLVVFVPDLIESLKWGDTVLILKLISTNKSIFLFVYRLSFFNTKFMNDKIKTIIPRQIKIFFSI